MKYNIPNLKTFNNQALQNSLDIIQSQHRQILRMVAPYQQLIESVKNIPKPAVPIQGLLKSSNFYQNIAPNLHLMADCIKISEPYIKNMHRLSELHTNIPKINIPPETFQLFQNINLNILEDYQIRELLFQYQEELEIEENDTPEEITTKQSILSMIHQTLDEKGLLTSKNLTNLQNFILMSIIILKYTLPESSQHKKLIEFLIDMYGVLSPYIQKFIAEISCE